MKLLLTSRPQVQEAFQAWNPEWLKPEAEQNQQDMYDLLHWRLVQGGQVTDEDIDTAARLLLGKSGGQFIYSKVGLPSMIASGALLVAFACMHRNVGPRMFPSSVISSPPSP